MVLCGSCWFLIFCCCGSCYWSSYLLFFMVLFGSLWVLEALGGSWLFLVVFVVSLWFL